MGNSDYNSFIKARKKMNQIKYKPFLLFNSCLKLKGSAICSGLVLHLASCLAQKRSLICFMSFLLLFLCSCKDLKEAQCTGVKGFKVNKLDPSGINADVLLGIKNPNNFSFSVYRSTFDVYYNGTFLGKARSKKVRIDANTQKTYSFNLKSDFKNVSLMDVLNLAKGGGKGTLQVKGNLKAGKFYIKKKIPIDVKERVSMDK